jgi:hypothetical protein
MKIDSPQQVLGKLGWDRKPSSFLAIAGASMAARLTLAQDDEEAFR